MQPRRNNTPTQTDRSPGRGPHRKSSSRGRGEPSKELAIEEHTNHAMSNCHTAPAPTKNTDRYFVSGAMSIACELPWRGITTILYV